MITQVEPLFAYMNLDKIIHNDSEFLQCVESEFSNVQAVQSVFSSNMQSSNLDEIQIGNDSFYVVHYEKKYSTPQRVVRFFEGLALTLCTGFLGLFDQRVRHKWDAALFGSAQKHLAISKNVSTATLGKYAIHSFVTDPLGSLQKGKGLVSNFFSSMTTSDKTGLEDTLRSFFHLK